MDFLRHLPGYLVALALVVVAGAHSLAAWYGWMDRFGAPVAFLALTLSLGGGFNAYGIVGAWFYATDYLHWPPVSATALAAVGLLFATRGIIGNLFKALMGRD